MNFKKYLFIPLISFCLIKHISAEESNKKTPYDSECITSKIENNELAYVALDLKDYSTAFTLFKQVAESKNRCTFDFIKNEAQYNIGVMYQKGLGVEQSDKQAVYWWKKSAEKGYSYAQFNIGLAYLYGKGVKRDLSKAEHYLTLACDNMDNRNCELLNKLSTK